MYVLINQGSNQCLILVLKFCNVVMRNNGTFFPYLALLIKLGALHQQSQDFHKIETHYVKILFMYMLAAASVMNRKQVRQQALDVSTCCTLVNVNENGPQTDALFT
jgi:hypothetical protein